MLVQVRKQNRAQRIRSVFGISVSKGLIDGCESLDHWVNGSMFEYFTTSATSASNGRLFLNVNQRPCTHSGLAKAIRQEFKSCAGPKLPTVLVWLTVPRTAFTFLADHPLISVTFSNETVLQKEICRILRSAWKTSAETLSIPHNLPISPFPRLPFEHPNHAEPQNDPPPSPLSNPEPQTVPYRPRPTLTSKCQWTLTTDRIASQFLAARSSSENLGEHRDSITSSSFSEMELIGQWNHSFIITRLNYQIYAIDQHAACEAVNFEKFRHSPNDERQHLISPVLLPVSPEDQENAVRYRRKLNELGFKYEVLDGVVKLFTVPSHQTVARGFCDFQELLGQIHDAPDSEVMTVGARSQLAYHACHASVRAGDKLSRGQMRGLLERMAKSNYPWNCPHGRPTWCCIYGLPIVNCV
jgi:DNA mismatch repair ATPase MutL